MWDEFLIFAAVGFCAQIIDGSLGMGFGVISSAILLAQGVPPALASASVNTAKLPTTATAALSHFYHKNLDWALVRRVAVFGATGGVLGAVLLTSLKGHALVWLVTTYLALMGILIIFRGFMSFTPRLISPRLSGTIGFSGGLIEGIGGSWGPIVTTSLLGAGTQSRYAIGTSNFCEFIVTVAVLTAFFLTFITGHWGGGDWRATAIPVLGLVLGGLPAAAFGGYLSKRAPQRPLTIAVGCLALGIAIYRAISG